MKKTLNVTFGTMLAVSSMAPALAAAEYIDFLNNVAVWVEGTYTEPSNNGLSVGDEFFAFSPGDLVINGLDGGRRHVFLHPDHDFDYALGISYRLPNCHSRFFMTYDHYNNDETLGNVDIRNIGFEPDGPLATGPTQGVASYDIKSDEFRIGAIHDLYFGDHFGIDLLAFFEYDKVRQTLNEFNSQETFTFARETENRVRGWGPGVGFMTRWYVCNPHWHIFAGANTILLAVDNEYKQAFSGLDIDDGVDPIFYIYDPEDSNSLVGKLDINFGINYHCALKQDFCGLIWGISLGMRYMNMFNVFKNGNAAYNPDAELTGDNNHTGPSSFAANLGYPQDWGRWGPFLKFKIGGSQS